MPPKRKAPNKTEVAVPPGNFKIGDTFWARYGPMLYEGVVLDRIFDDGEIWIFVHYLGWHKRTDSWLQEKHALPNTEETIKQAAEMKAAFHNLENEKKKPKPPKEKAPNEVVREGKNARAHALKEPNSRTKKTPEVRVEGQSKIGHTLTLELPNGLQKWLVKDWDNVIRNCKIVQLPRSASVTRIFGDFVESKKDWDDASKAMMEDVFNGITSLFNRAFVSTLLYPFEKPQYVEFAAGKRDFAANTYGAEHLLRLLLKLPEFLSKTPMTDGEFEFLQTNMSAFVRWFSRNADSYLGKPYKATDRTYHDKVLA